MDNRVSCPVCQKAFSRQEHLKRHQSIHFDDSQRFQCLKCNKSFLRKDALTRHESTHLQPNIRIQSGVKACEACVAAKARCSRDAPCYRCMKKGISCSILGQNVSSRDPRPSEVTNNSPDEIPMPQPMDDHSLPVGSGASENLDASIADSRTISSHEPPEGATMMSRMHEYRDEVSSRSLFNTAELNNGSAAPDLFAADFWDSSIFSNINWLSTDDFPPTGEGIFAAESDNTILNPSTENLAWTDLPTLNHQTPLTSPSQFTNYTTDIGTTTSPQTENLNSASSPNHGEYYVDGEAARLPHVKRRRLVSRPTPREFTDLKSYSLQYVVEDNHSEATHQYIDAAAYDSMREAYKTLCLDCFPLMSAFERCDFPGVAILDSLVFNYLQHTAPTLPFLNPAHFEQAQTHDWRLLLAMAVLGSQYLEGDNLNLFAISMSELLRRLITFDQAGQRKSYADPIIYIQVQLLFAVNELYSHHGVQSNDHIGLLGVAADFCRSDWVSTVTDDTELPDTWTSWIESEERRRTGFCIWLVDCMSSFQFQRPPLLRLEDVLPVVAPCHEKLWNATSADEWREVRKIVEAPPRFIEALQLLYVDKRLPLGLGEFSRILIIHGLFHRTWEVANHIRQSLTRFEPTARKHDSTKLQLQQQTWPPAVPLYNKWRNAACDCIDILHWSANASIGAASGMEHPTVLHLHLARVVLLTPIDSIVRFAEHHSKARTINPSRAAADLLLIRKWASQDQFKSRLAAIHAGVLFWHVRKYSVNAFYESTAVALSTLMLWAFTTFSTKANTKSSLKDKVPNTNHNDPNMESNAMGEEEGPSPDVCEIILLDRPTDDELVQQFVRQGDTMRANMTGVGDLWGAHGARRVLREGTKLLGTLTAWRPSVDRWTRLLEQLHDKKPP